ncbi:MAG: hypothetical protein U5R48_19830 [Gammaproteobacteria bacterium]|nr:hypothetical protein [Gammaproteobacteria bacterium]
MYETILTEVEDGILTITLNRPDRLNAWTYRMGAEMADAVERAQRRRRHRGDHRHRGRPRLLCRRRHRRRVRQPAAHRDVRRPGGRPRPGTGWVWCDAPSP